MLDRDHWLEILEAMQSNRLRTVLTALGVFWGVFMLVAMLGFGNGLEAGVYRGMSGFATNAVYLWGRRTSMPYRGFQPGRFVKFNTGDVEAIRAQVDEVEHLCPRVQLLGHRGNAVVRHADKAGSFAVSGDYPEMIEVQPYDVVAGRFLNRLDLEERRKVAIIGTGVVNELFGAKAVPIGEQIEIQGSYFEVVGVVEPIATGDRADRQSKHIFVPFSTFQVAFNHGDVVDWFAITALPWASAAKVEGEVKRLLASRHDVAPSDPDGIGSWNAEESFSKISRLFAGIAALTWFVGVLTLIAGVIGVSNIMLIAVKERTKEIGIRRAVGATPGSIISMILQESVALTSIAGYAGLVFGVAVLELASMAVGSDAEMFHNPSVNLGMAVGATILLMLFGVLAGILPARAALRIEPIEALRAE